MKSKRFTIFANRHSLFIIIGIQFFFLSCVAAKNLETPNARSNSATTKTETKPDEKAPPVNRSQRIIKTASWAGKWSRSVRFSPARLEIKSIDSNKMSFTINAMNGANTGNISGTAKIIADKAFFNDKTDLDKQEFDESYGCKITFFNRKDSIKVETSNECSNYGGIGVYLDGVYKKGEPQSPTENLVDLEILPDKKTDESFRKLVRDDYEKFAESLQLVEEKTDFDDLNAKVIAGCVQGLCPIMRAIIMFDNRDRFWAAVTDADAETTRIYYYTNDSSRAGKLPQTIQKWIEEVQDENVKSEVIYKSKP